MLISNTCGADDVVSERADGITDEGQKHRGEDIVPAGAGHFSRSESDGREEKFESDPWDVEH